MKGKETKCARGQHKKVKGGFYGGSPPSELISKDEPPRGS